MPHSYRMLPWNKDGRNAILSMHSYRRVAHRVHGLTLCLCLWNGTGARRAALCSPTCSPAWCRFGHLLLPHSDWRSNFKISNLRFSCSAFISLFLSYDLQTEKFYFILSILSTSIISFHLQVVFLLLSIKVKTTTITLTTTTIITTVCLMISFGK